MLYRICSILAGLLIWQSGYSQPACENTEPFYSGGSIAEVCIVPESPTEEDEVFIRVVGILSTSAFDFAEMERDGNIIRFAARLDPNAVLSINEIREFHLPLGRFVPGEYTLEFYAEPPLDLARHPNVTPGAVRQFTVSPAPRQVPGLSLWGILTLIGALGLIAVWRLRA